MNRIAKLKEYLQENPEDSFLQHALALEYIKLGDDAQARVLFETILLQDAGYVGSYYHLVALLVRVEDWAAARQWYFKGVAACEQAGDKHALGELKGSFDELEELED